MARMHDCTKENVLWWPENFHLAQPAVGENLEGFSRVKGQKRFGINRF